MPPGEGEQNSTPEKIRHVAHESSASVDSVRQYLREIGKIPLLTAEEEIELSTTIHAGQAAQERLEQLQLAEDIVPARSDIRELTRVINEGKAAREHMITANLRLVVSIAKRYVGRGMDLLDLIQEGNIGLDRAVDLFDPDMGNKFSTYATWWIRQAVTRAIADQGRTIRIPVHRNELVSRYHTEKSRLESLNISDIDGELIRSGIFTKEDIKNIHYVKRQAILSLDDKVSGIEDGDSTLGDFIADKKQQQAIEDADPYQNDVLTSFLKGNLTQREMEVITLRYGLESGNPATLEEVGREFGVTRERIRQIESKTLLKLLHAAVRDPVLYDALIGDFSSEEDRLKKYAKLLQQNEPSSLRAGAALNDPLTSGRTYSGAGRRRSTPKNVRQSEASKKDASRIIDVHETRPIVTVESKQGVENKPQVSIIEVDFNTADELDIASRLLDVDVVFYRSDAETTNKLTNTETKLNLLTAFPMDARTARQLRDGGNDFMYRVAFELRNSQVYIKPLGVAERGPDVTARAIKRIKLKQEQRRAELLKNPVTNESVAISALRRYTSALADERKTREKYLFDQVQEQLAIFKNDGKLKNNKIAILLDTPSPVLSTIFTRKGFPISKESGPIPEDELNALITEKHESTATIKDAELKRILGGVILSFQAS